MKRRRIGPFVCLILKYLFAILFPVLAVIMHKMTWRYIAVALAEVILIAFMTNLLCQVKTWLGFVFNMMALLFVNIQFAVLYWGNTFISAAMLTNLDSLNAISGKIFVYGLSAAGVLLFSLLPVCPIPGNKKATLTLGMGTLILYAAVILTGIIEYLPYRAAYMLCQQMARSNIAIDKVDVTAGSMAAAGESDVMLMEEYEFYSDFVADYILKPKDIPEEPNVILILWRECHRILLMTLGVLCQMSQHCRIVQSVLKIIIITHSQLIWV